MNLRANAIANSRASERWTLAGTVLLAAYLVQEVAGLEWGWLKDWQHVERWKQLTGLALALLFIAQWRLTAARAGSRVRRAAKMLSSHRVWGAAAPVLLYLHADGLGHAYQQWLVLGFVALLGLGLFHEPAVRSNRPALTTAWLVTHVALATLLAVVIGYHGFTAFYYE